MKYDVRITFYNGTQRVIRYGMPLVWCETIINDDLLPQYEGEGATIEIIERR